ncbi:MFS transporter [Vineibacter terrae]|uniref:MFS transporter n=1 Tax=Vineibacter terrae TaxID=2586908 RepID=A0A5C8PCD2_9HYPH|nr:MFS transporter [Vineibacter terrae]TXL71451.1 MFS transporter [Vineibacter terrae]
MHAPSLESPYAWRLAVASMLCIAIGAGGLYMPVVAMTDIAAEFGNRRQVPSLAYTLAYIGTGIGGIAMGWLADRVGPRWPVMMAGVMIAVGSWTVAQGGEAVLLAGYGLLVGLLGQSGTFTPLVNNITGWFDRRRGTAIAIVAIGNAVGGFIWPQVFRLSLPAWGWRDSLMAYGAFAAVTLVPLSFYVRAAPVRRDTAGGGAAAAGGRLPYRSPITMALLGIAGLCCCAPMAMPVVHMVAFCSDLGFSAARGSEAVSLVLLVAIVFAFIMGRLADRIGPLPAILIGSSLQALALLGFMFVDSLPGLLALSGLMGIPFIATVQAYALALRDFYGARAAGWRLGFIMLFTLCGMALGGWLAGIIFDLTLRYQAAFGIGFLFNLVNLLAVAILHVGWRRVRRVSPLPAAPRRPA